VDVLGVGIYSASMKTKDIRAITLATIGSIKDFELFNHITTVIIDEAHRVNSREGQYKELIDYLTVHNNIKLFGLTATPYRLTKCYNKFGEQEYVHKFLHRTRPAVFKSILYSYGISEAIQDGYIANMRNYDVNNSYDLFAINQKKTKDYDEQIVHEYHTNIKLNTKVIEVIRREHYNFKHILIFVISLAEAMRLSDELNSYGVTSDFVSGETTNKERLRILNDFRLGNIKCVVNVGVLTTGYDLPSLDCVVLARPTMSIALYTQMVGRGLRVAKDKEYCTIIDLCRNVKCYGGVDTFKIEGCGNKTALKSEAGIFIYPSNFNTNKVVKSSTIQLTFGKYKNKFLHEVPSWYLKWLIKENQWVRNSKLYNQIIEFLSEG
ncbi:MAG: DEAD/DEAH box helicase, partial [Rickettsia sp.]